MAFMLFLEPFRQTFWGKSELMEKRTKSLKCQNPQKIVSFCLYFGTLEIYSGYILTFLREIMLHEECCYIQNHFPFLEFSWVVHPHKC
jgi:hypothetical protein